MSPAHGPEPVPDDLRGVADALRDRRPTLDPLALDRVKLRAMSGARRSSSARGRGFFMRSRLSTVLAVGFLILGTGGALAVAGGGNGGKKGGGNASFHQYRPRCERGKNHRGDRDCHGKPPEHKKGGKKHGSGYGGDGKGGKGGVVKGGLVGKSSKGGKGGHRGH
jgi:hypothetical protein